MLIIIDITDTIDANETGGVNDPVMMANGRNADSNAINITVSGVEGCVRTSAGWHRMTTSSVLTIKMRAWRTISNKRCNHAGIARRRSMMIMDIVIDVIVYRVSVMIISFSTPD